MRALNADFRLSDLPQPGRIHRGLDGIADGMIGAFRRRAAARRKLEAQMEQVLARENHFAELTDHLLQERLRELRATFRRLRGVDEAATVEALAAVREAGARSVGMRPFPVQILGALALQHGYLAEMATGEGKTLTACVAAIVSGWSGRPCHVVTANDYLAQRDVEVMEPFYRYCGVRASYVTNATPPPLRKEGHAADVTFTTSKELAADFLRDRLALGELQNVTRRSIRSVCREGAHLTSGVVMRGMHTAIVDEADSVLVDEAVTPLIISGAGRGESTEDAFQVGWQIAMHMVPGVDYAVDARNRAVEMLPAGLAKIDHADEQFTGLWSAPSRRFELIQQAVTARELFENGKQYVVSEGKVVIVDEFSGRMMPERKWRHGLHQLVEAKEGVEISSMDETLARISFQKFFRFFRRLSGMTGTGREASPEFWNIYRLPVVVIPTNRPCQRRELPDRFFANQQQKLNAVIEEVLRMHATRRPVLVGTRRIAESEFLATQLRAQGVNCELLNAVRHREEADIVARAGNAGCVTIATNMAGRGTDIKLADGVVALGGLHVIATERHETRRVDRQLYGRAGRQGDPGTAQSFVAADDELLRRFSPPMLRKALAHAVAVRSPGAQALGNAAVKMAQAVAQRQASAQRKQVLATDVWMSEALSFADSSRD